MTGAHPVTVAPLVILENKFWTLLPQGIFTCPSSDGTYYGMVMSIRPGLRQSDSPSVHPSGSPSASFPHFSPTCFDILS